jgi:hypothetical protein
MGDDGDISDVHMRKILDNGYLIRERKTKSAFALIQSKIIIDENPFSVKKNGVRYKKGAVPVGRAPEELSSAGFFSSPHRNALLRQ